MAGVEYWLTAITAMKVLFFYSRFKRLSHKVIQICLYSFQSSFYGR